MSVFVGGGTLEAAESVCNPGSVSSSNPPTPLQTDILDGITSLVDKSLLRQEERPDGEACFVMLETLREFGLERLAESGEEETTRRQHTGFFLDLTERAAPELQGPQQGAWLDRLEAEHDNLRGALGWALERGEVDTELRLCVALWLFWFFQGHLTEGRQWLESALARSGGTMCRSRITNCHCSPAFLLSASIRRKTPAAKIGVADLFWSIMEPNKTFAESILAHDVFENGIAILSARVPDTAPRSGVGRPISCGRPARGLVPCPRGPAR